MDDRVEEYSKPDRAARLRRFPEQEPIYQRQLEYLRVSIHAARRWSTLALDGAASRSRSAGPCARHSRVEISRA